MTSPADCRGAKAAVAGNIILTGFMATGKSAVSRALARRLQWPEIDCDAEIAARAGKPIPEIFRTSGEAGFRALERAVIETITLSSRGCAECGRPRPAVIATGGGAIVDPVNHARLAQAGVIVCLTARPEVIARRVGASAKLRPMLTAEGKPLPERISELMTLRQEAYNRAGIKVDTSDLTIEEVVDAIVAALPADWSYGCRHSV